MYLCANSPKTNIIASMSIKIYSCRHEQIYLSRHQYNHVDFWTVDT